MLNLSHIHLQQGTKTLYEDLSLHVKPHDKIGLVGANGVGKSSLLRLITNQLLPEEGDVTKSKDCSIGYLNQDLLSVDNTKTITDVAMEAFEKELHLLTEINELLKKLETDYSDGLIDRLSKKQEQFEQLDGYSLQSKAEAILEGLGFTTEELTRPMSEFSGGWRMRVLLAKILLAAPSLLLLDEPTNHLDLPSIKWLEDYIVSYPGAVMIVSHDKDFLDNTVTSIAHIVHKKVNTYKGNYTQFEEEKTLRDELQSNAFKNQQREIAQTEAFITKFKAKATKAKQAQSRLKQLEKIDRIEDIEGDEQSINFKFSAKSQPGKVLFSSEGISKEYPGKNILKNSPLHMSRGDKIALLGANGLGKSTVLRMLAGAEEYDGEIKTGHNVELSFYAQHQLESLSLEKTIIEEMTSIGLKQTELEIRSILGAFLFRGDDIHKKIKVLSGGEKSRVALAITLLSESNLLFLDEPTNHLDMSSIDMLIQALEQYDGSFITVSHNRDFISRIANKIWYIDEYQVKEYQGSFNEFQQYFFNKQQATQTQPSATSKPKKIKEEKVRKPKTEDLTKNIKKVESKIEDLESKKSLLESELVKEEVYTNPEKMAEFGRDIKEVETLLIELNKEWELLVEQMD